MAWRQPIKGSTCSFSGQDEEEVDADDDDNDDAVREPLCHKTE